MLNTSATRFSVEGNKVRCGEPGRSRGKRCGSTIMIGGKIACKAGHEFTLDELMAAAMGDGRRARIARWALAAATEDSEKAQEQVEAALREVLSPPYTTADRERDVDYYYWMNYEPVLFTTLLWLADKYKPDYAETLRQMWIERSLITDTEQRALQLLTKRNDFRSLMQRNHLIECATSSILFTVQRLASLYYRLVEASKVLAETESLWLYEDSLEEASRALKDLARHPIVFDWDDRKQGITGFGLYLRRPDVDPDIVESRICFKIANWGVWPEVSSGEGPTNEEVKAAIATVLKGWYDWEGEVLKIACGTICFKDRGILSEPQWQLKVVKDLRWWFGYMKIRSVKEAAATSPM